MGIKLIVTDLDGTFLDTYHTLNEENVKAVRRAREQGILCGRRYGAQLERL